MLTYIVSKYIKNITSYPVNKKIPIWARYETIDYLPSIINRKHKPIYAKPLDYPKSTIDYYEQYETTDMKR